jgi:hypothetical protein
MSDRVSWTRRTKEQSVKSWTRFRREIARAERARTVSVFSGMRPPRFRIGVVERTRGFSMRHARGRSVAVERRCMASWRRPEAMRGARRRANRTPSSRHSLTLAGTWWNIPVLPLIGAPDAAAAERRRLFLWECR